MEFSPPALLLHLSALLLIPPFFLGVIAKTKAFFAGRNGPPFFQGYRDLLRLFRKKPLYSGSSTWIIRLAPPIAFTAILLAGTFVPLWGKTPFHFEGDLILFAYLLGLGRFLTILAAMDVGSSFEGMGASREATFGAFSELSFFLGLVVLVVLAQSTSLTEIFRREAGTPVLSPALSLLFISFFLVLLTENSRMPIDDPNTHLELTMIHEGMILDFAGPSLGLTLYGASMKLFIFLALTVSLLWPPSGLPGIPKMGLQFLKWTGMAVLIGVTESTAARVRLLKIPQLQVANFVIVLIALLVFLLGRGIK